MGIRKKLVCCLLAVLFPLITVGVYAFHLFDQEIRSNTKAALANTQRLESARISEILTGYAQDARSLASDHLVRDFLSIIDHHKSSHQEQSTPQNELPLIGGLDGLAIVDLEKERPLQQLTLDLQRKAGVAGPSAVEIRIVDRQGQTLGESVGFSWEPAKPDLPLLSMNTVKTIFGDAFVTGMNEKRLGLISPVVSPVGEVVGAILLETRLNPVIDIISLHEGAGKTTEAYLAQPTPTGAAQLITALRFDRTAAFQKLMPETSDLPISLAMTAASATIFEGIDYRGVESIASVERIDSTGWGLVVKIDSSEAYAPLEQLKRALTIAGAISLMLILAAYTILLGPIAHRLKKTACAAEKISEGDLSTRVSDLHTDEIGDTARTIDSLAMQLEQDQKKRLQAEEQLLYQATHDELTDLHNRKFANNTINELDQDKTMTNAVLFLDLNGFKDVNDYYGHAAGDEVLVEVAARLEKITPDNATLARWGGDEFVMVLPDTDRAAAELVVAQTHATFNNPISTNEGIHSISTSVGIATSTSSKSLQDALVEADILMYEDKKSQQSSRSIQVMASRTIKRALQENRVEIWYEPIVQNNCNKDSANCSSLIGAEAKIRIRSLDGGVIAPGELIRDLNDDGLASALFQYALVQCLNSLSRWQEAGIITAEFKLHFELDAVEIQRELAKAIENTLTPDKAKLLDSLIFNVGLENATDSAFENNKKQAALDITKKFAVDLSNNNCTPRDSQPNIVVFDSSNIETKECLALLKDCNNRDITVVANGVTSEAMFRYLSALGVTAFQGPLFDVPLKAVDFVSRWGHPTHNDLTPKVNKPCYLRPTG